MPFKNFVVVSDPRLIPAVLGRPGLPKTQLYKMTRTVSTLPTRDCQQCRHALSSQVLTMNTGLHDKQSWCSTAQQFATEYQAWLPRELRRYAPSIGDLAASVSKGESKSSRQH